LLGGGEHRVITRGYGGRYGAAGAKGQYQANTDFSIW